jgi:hypothetical protein
MTASLVHDEQTLAEGGESLKYQLTVLAPSVTDAVTSAGGWLFDRVMAGWDVKVLIPGLGDQQAKPLAVLGASAFDLDTTRHCWPSELQPEAIAVAAALFTGDDRVRREVASATDRGLEVAFWGAATDTAETEPVDYPLTAAAHAFKCRALALTSARIQPVDRVEKFFARGCFSGVAPAVRV